jgi:hypothetical protein
MQIEFTTLVLTKMNLSLSLCGVDDGGMKDLDEEDHNEDRRKSSASPDLFFSIRGRTLVAVNVFSSSLPSQKLFLLKRWRRR